MAPSKNCTRIDSLELKSLIMKKIGHQRGQKYLDCLTKFFSLGMSKCEFDRLCVRIVGRENISLHNKLIRSIIKNACVAKVPPPKGITKVGNTLNVKTPNGSKNSLQSLCGDAFPPSPRKCRSRKFRDRPSPLGPLGKPQSIETCEQSASKANKQSPTELNSLGSRPPVEVASVEDGEEVEQMAGSPGVQSRSPVTAPIGIAVHIGRGSRKSLSAYNNPETCQSSGELPDSRSLRSRLERKLEMEGMSVSLDCVNLLNNGLDAFLKRLIELPMRLANVQRSRGSYHYASMVDFCAAMQLDPRILGEDWPMQLEKICLRASED